MRSAGGYLLQEKAKQRNEGGIGNKYGGQQLSDETFLGAETFLR